MADVFLSYSVKDRDAAYRIAALLEWTGWTVWWDQRLRAGTQWRSSIDEALGNSRCMVVLWSKNSISSQWVKEEAEQARQAGKLVPVRIDDTRPPIGFREIQYADLSGWDGAPHAPAFRQLVLDLETILGKPDAPVAVDLSERYRPPVAPAGPRTGGAPAGAPAASPLPPVAGVAIRRWPIGLALLLAAMLAVAFTVANWQALFAPASSEFPDARKQAEAVAPAPQAPTAPDPPPTSPPSAPVTTAPPPAPASKPSERSRPPKVAAEREPRADRGSPPAAADGRCADILQRAQLGERLSADDRAFLQRSCR